MKIDVRALNVSVILTIVLIVFLTIVSELSSEFKTSLAQLFGHHWVAKSILSIVSFVVVYLILSLSLPERDTNVRKSSMMVAATTILGGVAIFGFYVWHFLAG